MKFYIDNGYIEYSIVGTGIPLLLIHGYPLSRKIWSPQVIGLSDQAMVITLDLRGHGDSYPFDGPYRMDLLAEDCLKLLDYISIKSPMIVCGLSMGGYVTMAMHRLSPNIFKGTILISTRSGPDSTEGKAKRNASIKNAQEHGAQYIADGMINYLFSPHTLSTNTKLVTSIHNIMATTSIQGITGALAGMRDRIDSTSMFNQIDCPLLVIHGVDDLIIPLQEAELMHNNARYSTIVKIPEAGHMVNMEQPEKANTAIRNFLYKLDGSM